MEKGWPEFMVWLQRSKCFLCAASCRSFLKHGARATSGTLQLRDVDAALRTIVQEQGGKSVDDADEFLQKLKSDKRYKRDVY